MKTRDRLAFTLVELLIVITIIVILAALLFPAFASARAESRKSVCLSNLRQIGLSIALYAHDYDDRLPYAPDNNNQWAVDHGYYKVDEPLYTFYTQTPAYTTVLKPYGVTRQLFSCPQDRLFASQAAINPNITLNWFDNCGSSYQYDDTKAFEGRTLGGYPSPSENFLLGDHNYFHGGDNGANGYVNILFVDQHAKTVSWEERSKIFDSDP